MSVRIVADVARSALIRADGLRVEASLQPLGVWTVEATVPARDHPEPIPLLDFCFQPPWFQECVCIAGSAGNAANLLFTGQYGDRYYSAVCALDDSGVHWEVCERAKAALKGGDVHCRIRSSRQTKTAVSAAGLRLEIDHAANRFRRWTLASLEKNFAFTTDEMGVVAARLAFDVGSGARRVQYGLSLTPIE